jgi:hypothetical protein
MAPIVIYPFNPAEDPPKLFPYKFKEFTLWLLFFTTPSPPPIVDYNKTLLDNAILF